ncbi:MAG: hypothetical protein SOH68_06135 [Lactobacillus sp.]
MPLGKCLEQAAGSLIASGGFFVWPARRTSAFWLIYSTDLSQIVSSCDWYEPSSGIPHLLRFRPNKSALLKVVVKYSVNNGGRKNENNQAALS